MSRQSNFAKRQFFNNSMQRAQAVQKKKADIRSIKYGNISVPDPTNVVEIEDEMVEDMEVVEDE